LALRRGDLKFIYNYERTPTEVYSLTQDPDERHDLASTLDPQVIQDAETDMLVWNERVSLAIKPPVTGGAPTP
jgi:arylsulfatase A-like enzyme